MKCEIIRDLLPSYIDELTSKESNREIEEHMRSCPGCARYLQEMREGSQPSNQKEENQRAIKPFKKLRRSIWKAVGLTVLVCVLLFGGWSWYYGREWKADSGDVTVKYENVNGVVTMVFYAKNKDHYIELERESRNPDKIVVFEKHVNPLDKPLQKGGYYGYTFIDEDTIMKAEDGSPRKLTEEDTVTIEYGDKTETIQIRDLYEK